MQYLNVQQLRSKLGNCGRSTVYRYVDSELLPKPIKLGGRLFWVESQVDDAMAAAAKEAA